MLRIFFSIFGFVAAAVILIAGVRGQKFSEPPIQIVPDMKHQSKYITQHPSDLFADGRGDRRRIYGTIPVGYVVPGKYYQTGVNNLTVSSGFANSPTYKDTGIIGEFYGDGIPLEITKKFLERGQERYNIHCSICHDKAGTGMGVVKSLGLATVASLQNDLIKQQPDGQLFNTITHGKGTMGAYGPNIAVDDRWAIVAYLRVLHISQGSKAEILPASEREKITSK